jgi:hypothetical protein
MFASAPVDTMLNRLESYLAEWTGKASWPSTTAILESSLVIPSGIPPRGEGSSFSSQYAVFTYEIGGTVYSAGIRAIAAHQEFLRDPGSTVLIHYNPARPDQFYYPPACRLAGRLVTAIVLGTGILAIALAIFLHR